MKKLFTLLMALILWAGSSWAITVTIGTGTSTTRYPLVDYFIYSRSQMLFLASEVTTGGTITHLRWYRNDVGADPNAIGTTEIWLMETPATTLSGTAWEGPGSLVASIPNIDLGMGGGWYEIDITDFSYSGASNLLVSVRTQNAPYTAPHSYWRFTTTSPNYRMRQGGSDSSNPPTMNLSYSRPNLQIEIIPLAGPPACANNVSPADLIGNVLPSATLNWSAGTGGPPTGYKLFFGTDNPPANIVNGTNLGLVTTYDPNPDMNYSMPYFWQIVPTNSYGEPVGCPVWTFTTGPDPTIMGFPSCESYDATTFPPYGWITMKTAGAGTPGTWDRQTTGTYPTCSPHSGIGMTRYNSYTLPAGTAGILATPPVNFPSDLYRVEFWMYRDDGLPAKADLVNVYYNTSTDLSGAILLGTINRVLGLNPPETSNGWYQYYFDMPPGSGGPGRYVIFEAVSQYGNNIFIDDVCLVTQPLCTAPVNLTATNITTSSADIGWTSTGTAWEVEYGAVPYTFTGSPTFSTTSNPHPLGGLAENTAYTFKVRNVCAGGLYSTWSGTFNFTTLCEPIVNVPYSENFDGVVAPVVPPCITVTDDNGDAKLWQTYATNPRSAPNAMSIVYNATLAMDDWFFTPGLNLTAGVTYDVKFHYRVQNATYPEKLQILWGTAPNAAGMNGDTIWDNNNISNITYSEGYGSFTPAVSGVYYVGWHGYSAVDMYRLYVDDISITPRIYYSVSEVYTEQSIQEGDTIWVFGDYSSPEDGYLLNSYMDFTCDRVMPPHSLLILDGIPVPEEAWYGGTVSARGKVHFVPYPDPYHSEDTQLAILTVVEYHVYFPGWDTLTSGFIEKSEFEDQQLVPEACDPCKFAILISGGIDHANNHSRYYKHLADLYKLKTEKQNYCPENIYVHYYHGKDSLKAGQNQIPDARISKADKANIQNSFDQVAQKVHACKQAGKESTFQKMVTNHGKSNGDINLLGSNTLSPTELSGMQQKIIDTCCSTIYDEFIQCYAGKTVDAASGMDIKNKTTVRANSPADDSKAWSGEVGGSVYLATKIAALKNGDSYEVAVAKAQVAYDAYLKFVVTYWHERAQELRVVGSVTPDSVRRALLKQAEEDSADAAHGVGRSRNVVVFPMKKYCEWKKVVVPPGGQLVLEFKGERDNCGNVTVYKEDTTTKDKTKIREWNWNISGSKGHTGGKVKRVFNGDTDKSTTFWVHNDNGQFTLTASANINQKEGQSESNALVFPGFSIGGSDDSSSEFTDISQSTHFIQHIDQIPFSLRDCPANMGTGHIESFGFTFDINPQDTLWTNMQLHLDIAEVFHPGILLINSENSPGGTIQLNITEPGIYTVPLGNMTQSGDLGYMQFVTNNQQAKALDPVSFSFDSWGLRSIVSLPLGDLDLGDAPDPTYPTLIINDGARHLITSTTFLGSLVDGEADGQPNPQSTGDDLNTPDDEDGVAFLWPLMPGNPCKIKVKASIGDALFSGWVDFNRNGSWADAGEQVFTDLNLITGENYLTFIVPLNSVAGQSCARFRFSHQPALSFTGYAFDGEVEDYTVGISETGNLKWQQLPDPGLPGTHSHDNIRCADDFICNGGQITEIGWWGNYELNAANQEKRGAGINHFQVNIYANINCLPLEPPFMSYIVPFTSIQEVNTGMVNNEGCAVYYYSYALTVPYPQIQGTQYWVSILALPNNMANPAIWRWQEANRSFYPILCGAATTINPPVWQTIFTGTPPKTLDLAFVIKSTFLSVNVDPDPAGLFVQNEISMALVPGNTPGIPAALIAAYNDTPFPGGPGLGVSFSLNGGVSWTPQQLPYPLNPLGVPFADAFDPAATADGSGNLYVAHISSDNDWANGPESGFYIHKSTNGGLSWAPPVQIAYDAKPVSNPDPNYRFNDRCQIVADIHPGSPYYNHVYAVWIKDRGWQSPTPTSDIYFSSSSDGGATWTTAKTINEFQHGMANMPNPAVAPDGTLYVCWMDYNVITGGTGTIFMNKSTDGGATWLSTDMTILTPVNLPPLHLNGGTDVLAKGAAVIETSPTNSQELYITFAQSSGGTDEGDIVFGKSSNGGNTWIFMPKINDDITTSDQVLPWMAVKPNGVIDIAWYDRRNDPMDLNWDIYMATSHDGGNTFLANSKVNSTSAPSPSTPSGPWMGEYLGLVVDSTHAYICFTSSIPDIKGDILFNKTLNPTSDLDFGDAPDPMYPTLKATNGANHTFNPAIFMGNMIDLENDGQPDPLASGDDNNNLPDEDGVTFNTSLNPGQPAIITVQSSIANLFLQGWIDFNLNGTWGDPGEQILNNVVTVAGNNTISFIVPVNAMTGSTYARFRLSTMPGLLFFGPAPNGEVEDYQVTLYEMIDYGDAPDPSYPTLAASNGAQHAFVQGIFMGSLLDAENDGQPNANATGDNNNNLNDEDGVVFNTPMIPGQSATLTIQSSVSGYLLQGWIDFNSDGDWTDPGEHIITDHPAVAGPNTIFFTVPPGVSFSSAYARFRLSSMPGLMHFGWAPDGEVEDYLILNTEQGIDFGDAPAPYPTLLATNGARHTIVAGLFMGLLIDSEPDGQPNPNATGDNITNLNDEDGVVFNTTLNPGQPSILTVVSSIANLFLQGWIDFNADGDWADPGEQIISNMVTIAGNNVVNFMVPPGATTGQTISRFRLSTMPGLTFTGAAPNGEVEDYHVVIESVQDFDFGDAKDPLYPTLLVSNGARHIMVPGVQLGNTIDSEPDGLQSFMATGDDLNNLDDEDGVIFTSTIIPGLSATVSVTVSVAGFLHAWIDFNGNGTWGDPGDKIFSDIPLVPGLNNLTFAVPASAQPGNTYARFRFVTVADPALNYSGLAPDGEVEDYYVAIISPTGDRRVDPDPLGSLVQNEISLAVIPGTVTGVPSVILAAYNDHPFPGGPGLGVAYSIDGGTMWNLKHMTYPVDPYTGIAFADAFDPTTVADGNNNLYVGHISTDYDWTNGPSSGLFVHKSTDNGVTWTGPYTVATNPGATANPDPNYRFNDRCQLAVDLNPASQYHNRLYVTWIKDRGWNMSSPMSDIYFSYSSNGGVTWSPAVIINETQHNMGNMPIPAVGKDGAVYICWIDYNVQTGGVGFLYLDKSTDGGVTWQNTDQLIRPINLPPINLTDGTRAKGAAIIKTSPINSGELYITFAENPGLPDFCNIYFIRSTDYGLTWSTPVRVNDDQTFNDQMMPWMDVKPNGTIDIAWYDKRNDPANLFWDVYFSSSMFSGTSFSTNAKINDNSYVTPSTSVGKWMGEYLGLKTDSTHAYIAFTSSFFDVNGDILFDTIKNPAVIGEDWGDAPDPRYPTYMVSNGARHTIVTGFHLGTLIDPEPDGLSNSNSAGDDGNNLDDEDGVTVNWGNTCGWPTNITVKASAAGFLDAWWDFGMNGWGDPGEQIFTSTPLVAGNNILNFIVPPNANRSGLPGYSSRFRFSQQGGLSYTGLASSGEVEDYEVYHGYADEAKWKQPVDTTLSALHDHDGPTQQIILADDFICWEGNITAIRWFGTYEAAGSGINHFHLSIHNNGTGTCLIMDPEIWGMNVSLAAANQQSTGQTNGQGELIYRYQYILAAPLNLAGNGHYWLDISVISNNPNIPCQWKWQESARSHVPAVCSAESKSITGGIPGAWTPIYWSGTGTYTDLAFQILSAMDFGDAPAPYPTLLTNSGACHGNDGTQFLGTQRDTETNGQPSSLADGDDNNGTGDDEDGVTLTGNISPGGIMQANIIMGASGVLQAFVDFNADGDWSDTGEWVLQNQNLIAGNHNLLIPIPPAATLGVTYARFRVSNMSFPLTLTNVSTGYWPIGEVEDYRIEIMEMLEYGDAPDPNFPTLLASNGARHSNTGLKLGNRIDVEPNGQPNSTATGDDNNPPGLDDEDGIWWPFNFVPGHGNTIRVTASGPGYLNAWMDFNNNGTWEDPAEKIFSGQAISAGVNDLSMSVPSNAVIGNVFARFRFSSTQNLAQTGLANDGEVEDYQVPIQPEQGMEYGDAPDSYQTLAASNGARHDDTGPNVFMGAFRDLEMNGQPSVNADADDLNPVGGTDDEDGVIFNTTITPGQVATLTITVNMTGGIQEGWIDFSGDGDFNDAGEHIIINVMTAALITPYSFNVPAGATSGKTYARFRYSTQQNVPSFGPTLNGEVEDYAIYIGEFDLGDAPDPNYPTLLASNGARHLVDGITYLGAGVDTELDGQPVPAGMGDDNNGLDDEDGITFDWPLLAGNPAKVTIVASTNTGFLNGWVDFNADGDWVDPGEQVFTDKPLVSGPNNLHFFVPLTALPGTSYARFRFSTQLGLSYTGAATDGEVEDYQVEINTDPEIKWTQLPDVNLPGLHAHDDMVPPYQSFVLADDWQCNGGMVTDIHWWGNYEVDGLGNEIKGSNINHFHISIHNQTGATCLPTDPEVWGANVPFSAITEQNTGLTNIEGSPIYLYEYLLIVPFNQVAGNNYWVDISAFSNNANNPVHWRWQEAMRSYDPILCGAVKKTDPNPGIWNTIIWNNFNPPKFSDLAFTITSSVSKTLNLKLYLEGLYLGAGTMNKAQDEFGDHFTGNTADQVTVELHKATNYSTIEYAEDSVNVSTGGNLTISTIPNGYNGSYYITVKHRNSIETTSALPVSFAASTINYDFSTAASQAYGDNQKDVGSGYYAIWGGDVNHDGIVDSGDMILIENASVTLTAGYVDEDVNGDGLVDSSDMLIVENNSIALITAITP